ncbi:glutaminase A [Marinicrinis lubricantis]|uniref:Glutaminase n=1 Tax=Marinicrinis lubricantis TaxID=2086470 RepID=A0ABW1IK75_9BACL
MYSKDQLEQWLEQSKTLCSSGKTADYIPALAKANPHTLGITLFPIGSPPISCGDESAIFTLQSISKVFTLLLALMDHGEEYVFERVGMEPTGDDFNSMLKLELVPPGKPFNPLINAGAITVTSMIKGESLIQKWERIAAFISTFLGEDEVRFNQEVYSSEKNTANRNRSLAYFLKDVGVLEGDVEENLDLYFKHCAIEVDCRQLARMGMILAGNGIDPVTSAQIVPKRYVQIAKTFMLTCGMYNASGEFAIKAGIPAKSGVSGGILAVVPGKLGIGVIGPALNEKGNSIAGVHLLQKIASAWELSMF